MSVSDFEIRKLDERWIEPKSAPRCPKCEVLLILARGYVQDGKTVSTVFEYPTCPNCGYGKERRTTCQ